MINGESLEDWAKRADAQVRLHRIEILKTLPSWVEELIVERASLLYKAAFEDVMYQEFNSNPDRIRDFLESARREIEP